MRQNLASAQDHIRILPLELLFPSFRTQIWIRKSMWCHWVLWEYRIILVYHSTWISSHLYGLRSISWCEEEHIAEHLCLQKVNSWNKSNHTQIWSCSYRTSRFWNSNCWRGWKPFCRSARSAFPWCPCTIGYGSVSSAGKLNQRLCMASQCHFYF